MVNGEKRSVRGITRTGTSLAAGLQTAIDASGSREFGLQIAVGEGVRAPDRPYK